MEQRSLGSTDLKVSALGFGCAPIGSRAGGGQSRRALRLAYDEGVRFFDTADMYGVGGSEKILGSVFGRERDKVVIATKCGYTFSNQLKALTWVKPLLRPLVKRLKGVKASAASFMASQRSQNFEPAYIERCVHDSLQRLGAERIDLFFLHDPSMAVIERGEALGKLSALKKAGKLRHFGVSSDADIALRAIEQSDEVAAVEVNASLLDQQPLHDLLPIAKRKGVGFIARQPFAHGKVFEPGVLTGALKAHGLADDPASVSALALRFVLGFEGISSILPSMMKPEHLKGNVNAIRRGPLSANEAAFAASLRAGNLSGSAA